MRGSERHLRRYHVAAQGADQPHADPGRGALQGQCAHVLQVVGAIEISWPSFLYDSSALFESLNLDILALSGIPCQTTVSFYTSLLFAFFMPIVVLGGMVLVHHAAKRCGHDLEEVLWQRAVFIIFLIFPGELAPCSSLMHTVQAPVRRSSTRSSARRWRAATGSTRT